MASPGSSKTRLRGARESDRPSGKMSVAIQARQDRELTERQHQMKRVFLVGCVAWVSFLAVDLYAAFALAGGRHVAWLVSLRAAGAVVGFGGYALLSTRALSAPALTMLDAGTFLSAGAFVSLMGVPFGGPVSPFLQGIMVLTSARTALIPAPVTRALPVTLGTTFVFPITLGLWALAVPAVRGEWLTRASFVVFSHNFLFAIGIAILSAAGSHVLWSAKKQVSEARKLGNYRLKVRIASGGIGEVWLARQDALDRHVALKVLKPWAAEKADAIRRFEREARAASRLKHPNTLRVYDFGASDDGVLYIAMELLDGCDLEQLVTMAGPLPPERVIHLARQACGSLAEAHANGVIHRDIKPANLFVAQIAGEYDVLKVLDFGLAAVVERGSDATLSQSDLIVGTPAYMAPEAADGAGVDPRSDLYALGGVMYFLLTGTTLFPDKTVSETVMLQIGTMPEAPSARLGRKVPGDLERVILRCLAKSPSERFANARELEEALLACRDAGAWTQAHARGFWAGLRSSMVMRAERLAGLPSLDGHPRGRTRRGVTWRPCRRACRAGRGLLCCAAVKRVSSSLLVPCLLLGASACVSVPPEQPAPAWPAPPPSASAAQVAPPPPASAPPSASASAYAGHGLSSVTPEVLAKFRPQPLPAEVARRIQSMLDLRPPSAGRPSPDGKHLFFNWAVTGVAQIWRVDGPGRFPAQLTGGEDVTILAGMTPDGKWLVVSRDRKGEENPGLYVQSQAGGPLVAIQHKPGVQTVFQQVSDDSRFVYFTSNDKKKDAYTVYRYDIAAKSTEVVFEQDGLWSLSDLHADGRLLLRKATGALTAELFEWDPAKKSLTPLFGQGESEELRAAYGNGSDVLILTSKGGDYRRLFRLDRSTSTPKLEAVTKERKFDVSSFSIDRKKARVLYQVNEGGYTRLFAIDGRTFKDVTIPKLPDADHVNGVATTPDGRFTSVSVDDGKLPRRAFVIDWRTNKVEAWHTPSTPEIDTSKFARATVTSYPAKDGTPIPVLVRKPEKCPTDPCAVVVHFHGGPEGQSVPGFNVSAQAFVDAGFVYVEPNVRGSDGYGKAWLAADDGPKRLAVITDIEDAARWARTTFASGGKAPKVGIYGGSYGGYSSLIGMTMFAGSYDVGVDIVGISSLVTFLQNTAPYRRKLRISEYGDPEKDKEALEKLSPINYVDRVKGPMLILQGATDPRVPAGEAVQIHEALTKRGIPSSLMIFADEGHGAQRRENQVLMLGHSVAFFEKHFYGK